MIKIWTDGSCDYRTKLGGYAFLIEDENGLVTKSYGHLSSTTSPRAEITAVIKALDIIEQNLELILISDNKYVIKGISLWMYKWKESGWRIKNPDLWKVIYRLIEDKNLIIHTRWIKGHSGDKFNEECDRLAELGRKQNVK